jgi:LysM repeat protein
MGMMQNNMVRSALLFLAITLAVSLQAQDHVIRHQVQSLETFYSLSVKYGVTIDQIKAANPDLAMPRAGEYINIPVKPEAPVEKKNGNCQVLKKGRSTIYEIALLIPLYLEQTYDSAWRQDIDPLALGEVNSFRFIQFYHGFMLAADSMRSQGMNLKIHVFDVDNQSSKTQKVLADPAMKKMDLIVGPFLKNSFQEVADFARANHIPIINPFSSRQDILKGNPYVFKLVPAPESQPELLGKLVKRDFSDHNVIIYIPNKFQGTGIIEEVRAEVQASLVAGAPDIKLIDYASDSIRGFLQYASETLPNLIIVYSENEAMPTALLSKLNEVKSNYPVTIIGMPEWDRFNNLESGYLLSLNSHVFMSAYVDYGSEDVKGFIRRYREDYLDEPQAYAFTGFIAGYQFFQALYLYGDECVSCINELKLQLPQNRLYFRKLEDGGYENIFWNIMQYYDYSLIDRSVKP